ncbi:NADH-quinone oxidoreductase subunit N [Myxococcota bacterium]|nr:NADH-quinone oxidoreductase subunit N [Myxococcota bacterium]
MTPNDLDLRWGLMVPELLVLLAGVLVLLVDTTVKAPDQDRRGIQTGISTLACLAAAGYTAVVLGSTSGTRTGFGELFVVDGLAVWFKSVVLLSAALASLMSERWLRNHRLTSGGFIALLLFSTAGMLYMVSAADLVMLFLGLEIMSIPLYVLAASERRNARAVEAGLKYLVLGSLATGFLLFGISLLYGFTGLMGQPSTCIADVVAAVLRSAPDVPALAVGGGILLFVGMVFKVGAVPFHMWTPDVYEGSPMSITAFMSVAVKATAFAAILRVFGGSGVLEALRLHDLLFALCALTMVVGNVAALAQSSVKRMLAWSSVAHAGYILLGVLAGTQDGLAAVLFYSLGYAAMNIAAFGVLVHLSEKGHEVERLDQLRGIATRVPLQAAILAVSMLSLMGMPPLVGFWGKLYIFRAVVFADFPGHIAIAVLGVLMSAVSAYYYLRVVVVSYMSDATAPAPAHRPSFGNGLATATAAALTVLIGLAPGAFLALARDSAESLRASSAAVAPAVDASTATAVAVSPQPPRR